MRYFKRLNLFRLEFMCIEYRLCVKHCLSQSYKHSLHCYLQTHKGNRLDPTSLVGKQARAPWDLLEIASVVVGKPRV